MKDYKGLILDLQMFAEEVQTENTTDTSDNQSEATENKETKTEPVKKYTDADVDRIINKKFEKWQKDTEEKLKQANMTAEEKEQARIKKLEQLEKDLAEREAIDSSRNMLSDDELPEGFAKFIYSTQADVAKSNFEEFKGMLKSYRESIVNEVMKDRTPKAPKQSQTSNTGDWRAKLEENIAKINEA